MSIKSKRNPKPDEIKSTKDVGIFSLFAAKIVSVVQKVFLLAMRATGKEKMKVTALPTPTGTIIESAPPYTWDIGCYAGGGGIVAAFNDMSRSNIVEDEMPLDDSFMPTFTDADDTYRLNPSVASQDTFTDYWVEYKSYLPDPYTGTGTSRAVHY